MTALDDVVSASTRILVELSRGCTTAADAEQRLTEVAAGAGLRARLVVDVEAYDRSAHHNVIVRGPGHPTVSLSVAAPTGLPWALRGLPEPREYDLLDVNGRTIAVDQAMACLDGIFDDVRLMRGLVDSSVIAEALEEFGLEVSRDELQAATDAYRRARRLYTAEATRAWMRDNGLTPTLLARHVDQLAAVAVLRRHVVGADVQRWFAEHRPEFDTLAVAWVAGEEADAAALDTDPLAAVGAAWRAGRKAGVEQWTVGELPDGFAALGTAPVGSAVPVAYDGSAARAVVIERRTAVPDAPTMAAVERRLFDEWLAERRGAARVTWFWGDRRRTGRLVDAR